MLTIQRIVHNLLKTCHQERINYIEQMPIEVKSLIDNKLFQLYRIVVLNSNNLNAKIVQKQSN